MDIITVLQIMIGIIIFVMFLLVLFYLYLIKPKKQKQEEPTMLYSETEIKQTESKKIENHGRFQGELTEQSILDFMEFDEVIDNMIVRKNKTQYVMILQCNGINYDLMSEEEKISVEEGFVQFLNTLRFPIQLYVQSRTLNLKEIIEGYRDRVNVLKSDIEKIDLKIAQAKKANNRPLLEKLEFEKRRKQNVLNYGVDITEYVERLNSNQNILQQKTYVVVSYFVNELGGNLENYSKEEIDNMCFSELYTRCQNVSSSLASSQVTSRILDSEELVELLYVAYNRDESEIYQLSKALDAQYDALYSTGKDILEKKQEKLNKEINIAAIDLATDSILRADKQKQIEDLEKERNKVNKIKERANELLDQYEDQLNPRVFEMAKENVEQFEEKETQKESKPKTEQPGNRVPKRVPVSSGQRAKSVTQTEAPKKVVQKTAETPEKRVVKQRTTSEDERKREE